MFRSTAVLSISSALFFSCSALGQRGGAIQITGRGDLSVSEAKFIDCHCYKWGGGILAEGSPSLSLANSYFILCSTGIGGACGFYERKTTFSVSNCLFSKNSATEPDPGGGAIQDCVYDPNYICEYRFSFFTQNIAEVGTDIAANYRSYTSSPIIHCFTTATRNSFCNSGVFKPNWLPQS